MSAQTLLLAAALLWCLLLTIWRVLDSMTFGKVLVALVQPRERFREPRRSPPKPPIDSVAGDVVSALVNLGYSYKHAETAVQTGLKFGNTFDTLLKAALRELKS